MRRFVLSLVVLIGAVAAANAQQKSTLQGGLKGAFGSSDSATGGLRGVYGPPESGIGELRGVYGPPQSPQPTPLPSTISGPSSSNSGSVPNVTVPGKADTVQTLPEGVQPTPMPDRPGYGRAIVNNRPAIIDLNDNRIVQFAD